MLNKDQIDQFRRDGYTVVPFYKHNFLGCFFFPRRWGCLERSIVSYPSAATSPAQGPYSGWILQRKDHQTSRGVQSVSAGGKGRNRHFHAWHDSPCLSHELFRASPADSDPQLPCRRRFPYLFWGNRSSVRSPCAARPWRTA